MAGQKALGDLPDLGELLQYQSTKARLGTKWVPFRKYGMQRMRLSERFSTSGKQLWGCRVVLPDSIQHPGWPLNRQLQPTGHLAFAAIDDPVGTLQLVFWDKRIYRQYAQWLSRIGFNIAAQRQPTNVLPFRKDNVSFAIDISVWPDCYILEIQRNGG